MSLMTKKELANSLKKLMSIKPLDKITIKDITADCNVNRQTFYYHFQDIYDLLDWIYKTEAIDDISEYKTYKTWQKGFLMIFHYIIHNKEFCINSLHSLGRDHLDNFLYKFTFDLIIEVVNEVSEGMDVLNEDKKFIANFYTYAFVNLVIMWMKNGMKESPEIIIEKLNTLIEGDIEKALKKYDQK
ncbi:TetR/AcrR family transcriptional regulator [Clostridium tetani]|uniref:TetR family transcriptional regulator n=1 Tax=Clostridium tetani TaxID=1513 RepID=A0A4Q0VFU3_CLOTA|nr:TetR/AcrR family transcriptional regulator [Clostridium tetani]KGI44917.1 TetR family transcriptional regulator [Clostridium tetani]RXI49915.1 TetR family transcriptional regulator [Clostridium tetani]RXI70763.1 TetR family transcriptional regulator [Clostridium tetani]BDR67623.1 TetR family transcriptional regulator [Clostridium tetani]BDR73013.1 TetR family transcriptional regulator [Clostridium tetani]